MLTATLTGRLLAVVGLALLAAGCRTGGRPTAATQGSLRDARQSLEGEWTLERFERPEARVVWRRVTAP